MGYSRRCFCTYSSGTFSFARYDSGIYCGINVTFGCFGGTCKDGFDVRTIFFTFTFTRCFKGFRRTNGNSFGGHADGDGFAAFGGVAGGGGFFGDFGGVGVASGALSGQDGYGLCCTTRTRRRARL